MSIKTQRKPTNVRATMGTRTMKIDPEDLHRIVIETRAKPGLTVVPHKKWANGAWLVDGEPVDPPEAGRTYRVDLNLADGGNIGIAYPTNER